MIEGKKACISTYVEWDFGAKPDPNSLLSINKRSILGRITWRPARWRLDCGADFHAALKDSPYLENAFTTWKKSADRSPQKMPDEFVLADDVHVRKVGDHPKAAYLRPESDVLASMPVVSMMIGMARPVVAVQEPTEEEIRIQQILDAPPPAILQFFDYEHLPPHLQEISRPFAGMAHLVFEQMPDNEERSACLRKLLEAKDCAVRALIFKEPAQ